MTVKDHSLLGHYLKTLAFRFRHTSEGTDEAFADFEAGMELRTPRLIVRHMTGLVRFSHEQFQPLPNSPTAESWEAEQTHFLEQLRSFYDLTTVTPEPRGKLSLEQLWQGPLTDAMTHVGQLAMLRRLAGDPCQAVRYWAVRLPEIGTKA